MQTYNIYCDESCHLEHDQISVMVLGAVWCPKDNARLIAEHIRGLKSLHGLSPTFEIKWSKVSPSKISFYLALLDYFFGENDLHLCALIVPDKRRLREVYGDHNTSYYQMYFTMLKRLLSSKCRFRVYIDIKDTRGAAKVRELKEALCNNLYDFKREIVERMQLVRSHEVEQIQLTDFLIGCISYVNRGLTTSSAKNSVASVFKKRSGWKLTQSTLPSEKKVNLYRWTPTEDSA